MSVLISYHNFSRKKKCLQGHFVDGKLHSHLVGLAALTQDFHKWTRTSWSPCTAGRDIHTEVLHPRKKYSGKPFFWEKFSPGLPKSIALLLPHRCKCFLLGILNRYLSSFDTLLPPGQEKWEELASKTRRDEEIREEDQSQLMLGTWAALPSTAYCTYNHCNNFVRLNIKECY